MRLFFKTRVKMVLLNSLVPIDPDPKQDWSTDYERE